MDSLGTALPKECARVKNVLGYYHEIGPAGKFGAMMIEAVLKRADEAMISGDVVDMLTVFQELQDIEA